MLRFSMFCANSISWGLGSGFFNAVCILATIV
jgi:hypothetical protein